MAPSRKRGSARAAAAAAARQQWKVGDLVLAKMKGFPAWPAVISDPTKWGYSSDRKKLLVFFYGTKQIAFCNHADIEAFTEEKKKSLLTKRQGKGADFVRAVDEIIDIYDKLKKNDHSENNIDDEGLVPNNDNLEDSRSKTCGKTTELNSHITCDNQFEALAASVDNNTLASPHYVPVASAKADFCKVNKVGKEPCEKISILDQLRQTPLAISTTVRKRPRDVTLQSCATQRRVSSLHRSRSSSADPCKRQNVTVQQSIGDCDSGDDLVADAVPLEHINRKILDGEVQDHSPSDALNPQDSTDFGLNGICRESEHNTVSMESEALDCEAETMPEPSCQSKHVGNGYLDNDDKLNPELDASIKTVILKKRRNSTRKRAQNDSESALLGSNADLLNEDKGTVSESLISCSEINDRFHTTDGDEHLPLVKRARVRKGEPVVDDTQLSTEESGMFVLLNKSDDNVISNSPCNNCPDKCNLGDTEASECSLSIQNSISNNRSDMNFWKAKYQLKSMPIDVEAALPPSKRLHRALEAMSANADELKVDRVDVPMTTELTSNGCMDTLKTSTLHLSTDGDIGEYSQTQNIDCSHNVPSLNTISELSLGVVEKVLDANLLNSSNFNPDDVYSGHSVSKEIDMGVKDCDELSPKTEEVDIPEETLKTVSDSCEKQVPSTSNEVMVGELPSSVVGDMNSGTLQSLEDCHAGVVKREVEDQILEPISEKLYSAAAVNVDPVNEANTSLSMDDRVVISKSATLPAYDMKCEKELQDCVAEITLPAVSKDRGFSPDLAPIRVLIAAAQAKRVLSRSTSFSYSVEEGKAIPHSLVNYMEDSSEQGSPSIPSATHGAPFDDKSQTSPSSSSPALHQKGAEIPVEHAEAEAARRTFEVSLHMLSRTKESIGRATQLAIECAKYGIAGEVIELLLRNLERESRLYRRIDLFFLVDSIVQCSRTQKGGAGDVFASLVQSVLSRLLYAAAPPGKAASENRRQCLKVLRLWLERKTLPESIVRHHIRELDFMNEAPFSNHSSRRPRTERAINDPIREMEGMLVDEYGSNTSFQLSGLSVPCVVEDDEHDCLSEEKSFEAVTPERNAEVDEGSGTVNSQEKHRHILEDVDGELEMEDVSPPCEVRVCSINHVAAADNICNSDKQYDQQHSPTFVPPLPEDLPPSPPPLPSSPPPLPSSCSPPSVVNQQLLVGASHALPVAVDPSAYSAAHNIRNQPQAIYQQPGNPTVNSVPTAPVPYCNHPYGDIRRHIPHPSSSLSCSSYGGFPGAHPTMHTTNRVPPPLNRPMLNSYTPQPPPARVSNQFSFVPAEPHQRMQAWGNCSSFPNSLQPVHDPRGGKFYSDRDMNGSIQHDIAERGRFSPTIHPGPMLSDKVDASTIPPPFYGPPSEPSSIPCRGWPLPPRISGYHSMSGPRPRAENTISPVEGVRSFWRPR